MNVYQKERLKTIVMVCLFCTMLLLTVLNFVFDKENITQPLLRGLQGLTGTTLVPMEKPDPLPEASRPVAAALRREGELQGVVYDTFTTNLVYDQFRPLLSEALASARNGQALSLADWQRALEGEGAYFQFLDPLPAWLLAEGLSSTASAVLGSLSLDRLLLTAGSDNQLQLMLYNGEGGWQFDTPIHFELPKETELSLPLVSFMGDKGLPKIDILFAEYQNDFFIAQQSFIALDESVLLIALGFNPNTNNRYPEAATGDMVYVDDQRTIHVKPGGVILYHDGTVSEEPSQTTQEEAIRLVLRAMPQGQAFWGEGSLQFKQVVTQGDVHTVTMSYVWSGSPLIDGESVFTVEGGRLRDAYIRLLPVYGTEESQNVLPQRQAALLLPQNTKLVMGYKLAGEGRWTPQWIYYE